MDFGDNVSVKTTPVTTDRGLAGKRGQVYGWTTPSVTGVSVIGDQSVDSAYSVHIDDLDDEFWFSEDLLEFVDFAPGTTISLGEGADKKTIVRDATGAWKSIEDER
jgi:hypothetical protein